MEIIIITGIAFTFSIILVLLESSFKKEENVKEQLEQLLPGYQCGGCGFGSCKGMVAAILKDGTAYQKCRPLKGEAQENLKQFLEKKQMLDE